MTAPARGIIALAMALMPFAGAFAKKPKAAEPDSLTRMVALFVAENTRRGIESMRTSFEAYGSTVDASAVRRLVAEQLDRPSDPVAYAEASKWISRFMDNRSEALSDHLLATAASEPDAEVLPSGVVIRIIQRGNGLCPEATDIVSFRYTGTLPDGMIFDTIGPDEEPMTARVSDLAPGLAEALTRIPAGSSAVITLPAPLAYGSEGIPGVIPPDSALRFEIEYDKKP